MTCQDCKHFYNREPKPWRTNNDIGFCDHGNITVMPQGLKDTVYVGDKIEVHKDCPINKWCDNKFEPKDDSWESVSK